jgi:hypothetical protein
MEREGQGLLLFLFVGMLAAIDAKATGDVIAWLEDEPASLIPTSPHHAILRLTTIAKLE